MSTLRIYAPLQESPAHCRWALVDAQYVVDSGQGALSGLSPLSSRSSRIELILPAADVLIVRARIPDSARHRSDAVLAFAVEDMTLTDAESNYVRLIGADGGDKVLAVIDKHGVDRWLQALESARLGPCIVLCETLMLPLIDGSWTLVWNGREGFVRSGLMEGAATDCGSAEIPPLILGSMLEAAKARNALPASILMYTTAADAAPDVARWQFQLGIPIQNKGAWDWRRADPGAEIKVARQGRTKQRLQETLRRLKPALWVAGAALAIHCAGLVSDWTLLSSQQRGLRQHMDGQFRAIFPDAVAIADPALQLHRKLMEARHAAGEADYSDFLPMLTPVAEALTVLPTGALRVITYENGSIVIEIGNGEAATLNQLVARLQRSGLSVERGAQHSAAGATQVTTLTVRTS